MQNMNVTIGIMQPYLFPYLGYLQLINAVDKFVIHDDVKYIKGGWINRNHILLNKKDYLFSFSLKKDSDYLNINQRFFVDYIETERKKFLITLSNAYKKAPYFTDIIRLILEIFSYKELNISLMITNSLKILCTYLDIKSEFFVSSEIGKNNSLKGPERVMSIVKILDGNHYINPIGGVDLYSKEKFLEEGIKLSFIKTRYIRYKQFDTEFIPNLSIIDVLMFNSKEEVKKLLDEYDLI